MVDMAVCPGCGLTHPVRPAPEPPGDLATSPECYAEFGEVLTAFYTPETFTYRQYAVDAYTAAHPDPSTRKGVQKTALSLMTMDLYLECGQSVADGSDMHAEMMRSARGMLTTRLEPPDLSGVTSHRSLVGIGPEELPERAQHWAREVWQAWAPHHARVRAWNEQFVPARVCAPGRG